MLTRLSIFITDTLIEGNIVKEEERNVYIYLFGILLELITNFMTTIIIGLILKKIVATLIFMLVFIPMRSTAGGYHCETAGKCYLFSMVVYLMVVFTYDCFEFGLSDLCVLICFIDFIVIVKLSPVISNNNPFVAKKKSRNRRISIDLSLIYILAYIVMIKSKIIYANEIFLSLTIAVIFMIIGYIKQKRV